MNKSNMLAPFLKLFTGSLVTQLVSFAAIPFITLLYTPEQFGELALIISLAMIASIFLTLRYEVSLLTAVSNNERVLTVVLVSLLILLMSPCLYMFAIITSSFLAQHFSVLYLVFISCVLAFSALLTYHLIKDKQFGLLAIFKFLQVVVTVLLQLVLGTYTDSNGLVVGYFAGNLLALLFVLYKSGIVRLYKIPSLAELYRYSLEKSNFPKYNSSQAIVSLMSSSMVLFYLSFAYGAVIVGLYALSIRIIQKPLSLFSTTLMQVSLSNFSDAEVSMQKRVTLFTNKTMILLLVSLLVFISLFFLLPYIFDIFFDKSWHGALPYCNWILIWLLFEFVATPSMAVIQSFNFQNYFLKYEVLLSFSRILIMVFSYANGTDAIDFLALFCMLSAFFNIGLVAFVFYKLSVYTKSSSI